MDLNSFNIHSLQKLKKEKPKRNSNAFPFERGEDISVDIEDKIVSSPFFPRPVSLNDMLFFDIETTGLSRGAGNMVFLAGVGYYEAGCFKVKQYFVSNPAVESRLIEKLTSLFKERKTVVSYNGKCFDIPVIKTRCVMNGIEEPDIEQIDLYHISRFIWKDRLSSFKLSDIERLILQRERKNDLPGSMAPFAYRTFLLKGETELLEKVFRHNFYDIVSLFYLFLKISDTNDTDVLFGLARKFFISGEYDKALDCLRRLLAVKPSVKVKKQSFLLAANCFKKKGNLEKAAELWLKVSNMESHIELAKYFEHKLKNYSEALKHTEAAIRLCENKIVLDRLNKRKVRILRKKGCFLQ